MRTLKSLIESKPDVWLFCRNECLQRYFLWQAENEGFQAINGQNPISLNHHQLYVITNNMKLGYMSAMVWVLSAKSKIKRNPPTRIDYEKYLAGESDYLYYGRLDEVPDRNLWDKIAYEFTDAREFLIICSTFIENQSYIDYKAYVYRWLIESALHYSPEAAFTRVLDNINLVAMSYAEKLSVSDCVVKIEYSCR